MAKGRNKPALYELVHDRPRAAASRPLSREPERHHDSIDEDDGDTILGISPGRVIRIPVGVVFLIAFGALLAVFGAYQLGYGLGREHTFDQLEHSRREGDLTIRPQDPLLSEGSQGGAGEPDISIREFVERRNTQARRDANQSSPGGSGATPTAGGPIFVDRAADDPREPGLNYYILATVSRDVAEEAARYLASRGIEVARLPVNSRGIAQVVALQGFERNPENTAEGSRYKNRIRAIGREYKDSGGALNFSDMYPAKYEGN